MTGEGYRVLVRARESSTALRAKGFTWGQIADVLALDHTCTPLRLHRLAHGRTAAEVVSMVNDLDPSGAASLRESRLYDFEAWPDAGRRPSVRILIVLAQIYQIHGRRLIPDQVFASYSTRDRTLIAGTDFGYLDQNRASAALANHVRRVTMDESGEVSEPARSALDAADCMELLRAIRAEETDVNRRELLFQLALAFGGSQALSLLNVLTQDEQYRLVGVVSASGRIDAATADAFDKLILHARHMDDIHGPATLLPAVNGQRNALAAILARETMSPRIRERLLGAYAQMSQLAGYLAYDLLDMATAERTLREGLRAALDLGDPILIGYLHCWLGSMANYQGRAAVALDHAFAARGWVNRSPSTLLRAMHASTLSSAYAVAGDANASARARDNAISLAEKPKTQGDPTFLYWMSTSMVESNAAKSLINLEQVDPAVAAAERSLAGLDPRFKLDRGFALVRYASALILAREISEAADRLCEAADIAAQHTSARLSDQLAQARARLDPWSRNAHVRHLDTVLQTRGPS